MFVVTPPLSQCLSMQEPTLPEGDDRSQSKYYPRQRHETMVTKLSSTETPQPQ